MRALLLTAFLLFPVVLFAQAGYASSVRSSPAYAEVLLRKTELLADLESVVSDYTETNPKILDLRFEITAIGTLSDRAFSVKPSEVGKLTLALGKLIVKKATLDMELNRLTRSYNKDHPDVKRAKRRAEIFENAINEILK